MQTVLIIPETEFKKLVARIEKLEQLTRPDESENAKKVYNVSGAADYLNMTCEGIRVARRQKRLTGFLLNEKEWGFHQSELNRYKNRYKR